MKKIISFITAVVMIISAVLCINIISFASAKDNYAYDCVAYARARVREYWGIELHSTGVTNGYYGAHGFYYNAANYGDTVSSTPKAGALAVWTSNYNPYGHVAFVENVNGSSVTYSEGGFNGHYNESTRNAASMSYSWYDNSLGMTCTQTFLGYVYIKGTMNYNPYIDVNGNLDGAAKSGTQGFATFDVYINGSLAADDATDYYVQHPAGTAFEIKDIKTTGCFVKAQDATVNKASNGDTTVTLFYKTNHTLDDGQITKQPTCTEKGTKTVFCINCTYTQTADAEPLGHDYNVNKLAPTCDENAKYVYICSRCNDSYVKPVTDEDVWSEWSTEKPDVDESRIETKTQYRYMQSETKLSPEAELEGWTLVGKNWGEGKTETVSYVESFPAGFAGDHSLYYKYNKFKPTAYENETTKVEVGSASTTGYIYWHWCSSYYNGNSPINRRINDYYTDWDAGSSRPYNVFHAFYSTEYRGITQDAGAVNFSNSSACNQTYWWQPAIPVLSVPVTTYEMMYEYTMETEWGEWTDNAFSVTDDAKYETRVLYRYSDSADLAKGHEWDNGIIEGNVKTYTCQSCGETKTEDYEAPAYLPGDVNADGNVNAADARLALRAASRLHTLTETQKLAADVTLDGNVNAADARIILRVSAKLETL